MTFNKEDIEFIEKAIEIKNKGYYLDGGQLTTVYNRVLGKNVNSTNCGSCLRGRISELEAALNHFNSIQKKAQDELKQEQVVNVSSEENKEVVEEKKRPGRPPKKS